MPSQVTNFRDEREARTARVLRVAFLQIERIGGARGLGRRRVAAGVDLDDRADLIGERVVHGEVPGMEHELVTALTVVAAQRHRDVVVRLAEVQVVGGLDVAGDLRRRRCRRSRSRRVQSRRAAARRPARAARARRAARSEQARLAGVGTAAGAGGERGSRRGAGAGAGCASTRPGPGSPTEVRVSQSWSSFPLHAPEVRRAVPARSCCGQRPEQAATGQESLRRSVSHWFRRAEKSSRAAMFFAVSRAFAGSGARPPRFQRDLDILR